VAGLNDRHPDDIIIQEKKLHGLTVDLFRHAGSEEREARLIADHLVLANLSGHDSHGVGMIPRYVINIKAGMTPLNQHAQVVLDAGGLLVVDGNAGVGQVVAYEAMQMAIERAKMHGVCAMALRNASHIGRIGHWGEMAAAAGLVSTHYVNVIGHKPYVAPFGGADARFSTNPYCCAIPRGDKPPFILDFATSRVAQGKVRVAYNRKQQMFEGALIDPQGNPTTDPGVMFSDPIGAILTFGEHKGYGMALACELLAGAFGSGAMRPGTMERGATINNMFTFVVDPGKIGDRIEVLVEKVMIPGDPERNMRAHRRANGIPIDPTTWEQIVDAGAKVGMNQVDLEKYRA
jgi:uncharacterized oxidoreductase